MPETCATCRFFRAVGAFDNEKPECWRYPPIVIRHFNTVDICRTETIPREWCGEWRPSDE